MTEQNLQNKKVNVKARFPFGPFGPFVARFGFLMSVLVFQLRFLFLLFVALRYCLLPFIARCCSFWCQPPFIGHSWSKCMKIGKKNALSTIWMASSSRDIFTRVEISQSYDLLRNTGQNWLESFIMSMTWPFLINVFSFFLVITYQL